MGDKVKGECEGNEEGFKIEDDSCFILILTSVLWVRSGIKLNFEELRVRIREESKISSFSILELNTSNGESILFSILSFIILHSSNIFDERRISFFSITSIFISFLFFMNPLKNSLSNKTSLSNFSSVSMTFLPAEKYSFSIPFIFSGSFSFAFSFAFFKLLSVKKISYFSIDGFELFVLNDVQIG